MSAEPLPPAPGAGLALLAHGARDPAWRAPFDEVVRRIAARAPGRPARLAFLEFMQPDLEAACHELAALGCRQVDVVPLFLGMGGHVRRDVPLILERVRLAWPAVRWTLHPAVGETAGVMAAMAEAALAAGAGPAEAA